MREITDTTNRYARDPIPDGTRTFIVAAEPQKKFKGDTEFWIWTLQWDGGIGDQIFLPSMMGGLLKVLGFTEMEPNKYDWETSLCEGKSFTATSSTKPDKKDPTKMRTHMGDFRVVEENSIPF